MAAMAAAGSLFNGLTGGVLSGFLGAAGTKALKADDVAEAVVEGLSDETVRGPIEPAGARGTSNEILEEDDGLSYAKRHVTIYVPVPASLNCTILEWIEKV